MAFSTAKGGESVQAVQGYHAEEMILRIEGLRSTGQDFEFAINVPRFNVEWSDVAEVLVRAGIPRRDAERLTDAFSDEVFKHTLMMLLTERTTRVG